MSDRPERPVAMYAPQLMTKQIAGGTFEVYERTEADTYITALERELDEAENDINKLMGEAAPRENRFARLVAAHLAEHLSEWFQTTKSVDDCITEAIAAVRERSRVK